MVKLLGGSKYKTKLKKIFTYQKKAARVIFIADRLAHAKTLMLDMNSRNVYVVSRKSRSAVKKNRIMKLYFVNNMTGQLYGHVTLTMGKLGKKRLSPF